jgi:hypothetical protein
VLADGERRQHQKRAIGLRRIDGYTVQVAR